MADAVDAAAPYPKDHIVSLRDALPGDSLRCQDIAVAAWTPIYAFRRRSLGDTLFARLHSHWPASKAGQIAAHFERHLEWVVVATTPHVQSGGQPATEPHRDGHDGPDGPDGLVGHGGEIVIGFVTYRLDPATRIGTIGNNAVDPAWQGRGVAAALYREVLARFRGASMAVAAVTTGLDSPHAPARAAYRKVGFAATVDSVTLYQEL